MMNRGGLFVLIIFPKDKIRIYQTSQDQSKHGVDKYGKPRKGYSLKCIVGGDLQSVSPSESRHAYGTQTNNTHQLYLNPGTSIKNTDIIQAEGYTGFFEIVGDPIIYTKLVPHIMISLRHIPTEKVHIYD